MSELDKLKKKLKKEFEENIEVDSDSDIPVREKRTKQKKVRHIDDEESRLEEE